MEYALVTGANRGIGYYLAKEMALDGYNLIMLGRDVESLEKAKNKLLEYGVSIVTLVYDLSDPSAPSKIYEDVKERGLKVSILANNAGFGSYGSFLDASAENELDMMQVNMNALVHLTHLFGKDMVANGFGRILNVASVAAFQSGPHMNIYFASKSFVLHFSEALKYELKKTGVTVTALCPGSTDTNFFNRAKVNRKADMFKIRKSPEKVAKIGYQGLKKGKTLVIPGGGNRALIQIQRFVPRQLVTTILGISMNHGK